MAPGASEPPEGCVAEAGLFATAPDGAAPPSGAAARALLGTGPAGFELTAGVRVRLERFVELLVEANAVTNLTGARSPEEMAAHLDDSLGLAPFVSGPLVDVGSGGGFPAIPLAIVTGVEVTLIESVAKKARFLERVLAELGLRGTVRAQRAEDAARDPALRERFATATARAVSSAPVVLELTVPFLKVGGRAVLQRGRFIEAERTATHDAALVLGASLREERRLGAAGDERRLLFVVKERPTGQRFPRRAGIPAKRPLCYANPVADG
jgi:16S rRNA (guanine527-N7)-methyltransferase